jgi:periplasmic divalent cation tolerance protein
MVTPATKPAIVMTTAGSEEQAANLAQELVDRRLAACVNVVSNVCSVYRWKGKVWQDEEKMLIIKTAVHLFDDVRNLIRELHTYELPEVVMLPIHGIDSDILDWLEACLSDEEPEEEADATQPKASLKAVEEPEKGS